MQETPNSELEALKLKINLFLAGLLWRSNDCSPGNNGFMLTYYVEEAIIKFLEEINAPQVKDEDSGEQLDMLE